MNEFSCLNPELSVVISIVSVLGILFFIGLACAAAVPDEPLSTEIYDFLLDNDKSLAGEISSMTISDLNKMIMKELRRRYEPPQEDR